ncbi:hypothetical protein QTP86_007546 [Hemibagrus guttatus]|nr:hypothetical protein QTP86_007546 [Hemibagrus guttatus]
MVMDQLSEEVRQESPWTMMFADDIVIYSESREKVEENLERWRFALERRGLKVSRSKTEYMCVNEREGSGTVRLQGEEVKKVQEFKYLGSKVQSNGECGKEVKKRVQAGWNGWRKESGVLCDRKISARIKGKVYRTVVRPAMPYGLETVSLRKRQESELEVAELKMLRFSLKEPMRGSGGYWMAILLFGSVLAAEARPSSDTLTPPDYRPLVRFRHKQDGIPESFQIKGLYGPNSFENACKHKYCGLGKHCVMDHVSGQGECQCLDRCKPHYKPVCGSNGKFYQNHCELHRASCLAHQRITIVHSEECFYKGKEEKKMSSIIMCRLLVIKEHLLEFYVEGAPLGAGQASQDGPGGSPRSAMGRGCPRSPPMGVPWGRTPPSPPDTADGTRLAWSSGGPTLGTPETPQCQGVAVAPHQS